MSVNGKLRISKLLVQGMEELGRKDAPIEACGYCAGKDGVVTQLLPLHNVDRSPEHYSMDPKEQFAALKAARSQGLELLGVYHSHPATPARMSAEDIRLANDPGTVYLILSLVNGDLKGFRVDESKNVSEVPVEIIA